MIPYTIPEIHGVKQMPRALLTRTMKKGRAVQELERAWAAYVGTTYAISFPSARAGLTAVYRYYAKNKPVALPAYTCIPAIDAARWAGGTPVFMDIELDTYNPSFSLFKKQQYGALSLSYLYGFVGDIGPFLDWATDEQVPVIEDAAIALGATWEGKKVGSLGAAGVFSLQDSKILSSWRGGIVTTNDPELNEFLRNQQSTDHVSTGKLVFNLSFSALRHALADPQVYGLTMYPLKKIMTSPRLVGTLGKIMGFNPVESLTGESPEALPIDDQKAFTNIQALIALASLQRIDAILQQRRTLAAALRELLPAGVHFPPEGGHAYGRFPIRIPGKTKHAIQHALLQHGIETVGNYPYICPQTPHIQQQGSWSQAEQAARETVLLPCHTQLQLSHIHYIAQMVEKLC